MMKHLLGFLMILKYLFLLKRYFESNMKTRNYVGLQRRKFQIMEGRVEE